MFSNLDSANQDTTKSIGIALNVSEQIVKALGGEMGFMSAKDVGSQFSFSIVLDEIVSADTNESCSSGMIEQVPSNLPSQNN